MVKVQFQLWGGLRPLDGAMFCQEFDYESLADVPQVGDHFSYMESDAELGERGFFLVRSRLVSHLGEFKIGKIVALVNVVLEPARNPDELLKE